MILFGNVVVGYNSHIDLYKYLDQLPPWGGALVGKAYETALQAKA